MTTPWITIVGIGDDGLAGLPEKTKLLLKDAELLVGGDRHQAMVSATMAERLTWTGGLEAAMDTIETWRGKRVVVLATGDPMCFGAGTNLQRRFAPEELIIIPHVSAFSHAAARMKWSLPDCDCVTVHGRPIDTLQRFIQPGVRLLILSWDGSTPKQAAKILIERGFGQSLMTVFEHMGGDREREISSAAEAWGEQDVAALNTLCVACVAGPDATVLSVTPGLPEEAFHHDGQITKREVRATTLARLMPGPGQLLWDVGAGSGSVGIEWMRSARSARAIAIEKNPDRRSMIISNAESLGVPDLQIVDAIAPNCFDQLQENPDAIFVGGNVSQAGLLEACFDRLARGGRLVANAVTIEAEQKLIAMFQAKGGDLVRLSVARADSVGVESGLTGFKPLMTVTQYAVTKTW